VRVDDRVLRLVTAINSAGDLGKLALRGARYGLPGWVTEQEARGGKTKHVYLEGPEADAKARDYLAGAKTAGDVAGCSLALIVMAMFAHQHAIAQSRRSYYAPTAEGMPWAADVEELVDALVVDNLGDTLLGGKLAARDRAPRGCRGRGRAGRDRRS
jgi:hypothetical protein